MDGRLHADRGQWPNLLKAYQELYHYATLYIKDNMELAGDDHTARAALKITRKLFYEQYAPQVLQNCTMREWQTVYAQAWYDAHGIEARLPSTSKRIIIPFTSIEAIDYGMVAIRYTRCATSKDGYTICGTALQGSWDGTEDPVWQSIFTVPGNLATITEALDEHGKPYLMMSVLCYVALCGTPDEFAHWLAHGVSKRNETADLWNRKTRSTGNMTSTNRG